MREIRLRGRHNDSREWVEGLPRYGYRLDSVSGDGTAGYKLQMHIISGGYQYAVYPDTVGQGVEVDGKWYYEGDIFWDDRSEEYCVLIWDDGRFALSYDGVIICIESMRYMDLVGNIWDNPELVGWYTRDT